VRLRSATPLIELCCIHFCTFRLPSAAGRVRVSIPFAELSRFDLARLETLLARHVSGFRSVCITSCIQRRQHGIYGSSGIQPDCDTMMMGKSD